MTTWRQLQSEKKFVERDAPGVGRVFLSDDIPDEIRWIRSLAGTSVDPALYADLQEAAHLWFHYDYDFDTSRYIGVEYACDVGEDYVAMPFRIGDATSRLVKRPDLWDQFPEYTTLLELYPKWCEAASTPRRRFFVELMTPHVVTGTLETVFYNREKQFRVIDLCPTLEQLERWKQLRTDEP
jgi:hypothetical protein